MRAITLERLRAAIASDKVASPPVPGPREDRPEPPIRELLGGEWIESDLGRVFIKDYWYPLDHAHGRYTIGSVLSCDPDVLRMLSTGPDEVDAQGCGFFDIETTGLSGGTGTYVVLAALGTFEKVIAGEPPAFRLRQYFLAGPGDEPAMLHQIAADLERCETLVTYNGRTFDVPIMRSRFTLARIESPWDRLTQIDLLHPFRRMFGHRMASCRLADAERRLLRIDRPDDTPGHLIPQIYREYLVAGRVHALRGAMRHNAEDVLSLIGVLSAIANLVTESHRADAADAVAVARWLEGKREKQRARQLYRQALPWLEGTGDWMWVAWRLSRLLRAEGAHTEAAGLLQQLWCRGDRRAGLALAIHNEHRRKDLHTARQIVEALLLHSEDDANHAQLELRHKRLTRKLASRT